MLSRRDREGYAIVKVSFKPEYKFDIDKLTAFDREEAERKFMESVEELLSRETGGKGFNDSHINFEKLQDEIRNIAGEARMVPDLSSYAKMAIQHLVKERVSGIYKNDPSGFADEIFKLFQEEHTSPNMVPADALFDLDEKKRSQKSVVDEVFEDRDRFRSDVADQLRRRVIKYRNFTQRKESDFIKPRVNEKETAQLQEEINNAHIGQLETKSAEMEAAKNNQDFDKNAYYKLKQELKERK